MKFGNFFGFDKPSQKDGGRENSGGNFMAIPEQGMEENEEDLENISIENEIERIKKQIDDEKNSLNPDIDLIQNLTKKLGILETKQ